MKELKGQAAKDKLKYSSPSGSDALRILIGEMPSDSRERQAIRLVAILSYDEGYLKGLRDGRGVK